MSGPSFQPPVTGHPNIDESMRLFNRRIGELEKRTRLLDQPAPRPVTPVRELERIVSVRIFDVDDAGQISASPGAVVYVNSSNKLAGSSVGTTGQALVSGGSGAPTWQNVEDGGDIVTLTGTGVFTQPRQFPAGSAAAPGVAVAASDYGMYQTANNLHFSVAGNQRMAVSSGGVVSAFAASPAFLLNSTGSNDGWYFTNGTTMVLGRVSPQEDIVQIDLTAGAGVLIIDSSGNAAFSGNLEVDGDLNHDGSNIGFFGTAPAVQAAAYTQTYSTAGRTLNAYTPDDESSAYTGIDNAQGGTVYAQVSDLNALRTAYENLRAFTEDGIEMLNAVVDDLQSTDCFSSA